jgi:citrate lyase subunit beta/citryl-CoA lyase
MNALHPSQVLEPAQAGQFKLPVCDHYCGVEARIRKSIQLQEQMTSELGVCVFDVTLDCEDGAPVGGELEHAQMVSEFIENASPHARIGVRVHPFGHPSFESDVHTIVARAGGKLSHLMLPKVDTDQELVDAIKVLDDAGGVRIPVHALIESPKGVSHVQSIAAHPRIQSLSFGVMDFVSTHAGAIPSSAMDIKGQFSHPLVLRAKMEISEACHAYGKVPSHSVITEFKDTQALSAAAKAAAQLYGFTRMWSIHPDQIRPIVEAFAPDAAEVLRASQIILAAQKADWAPISFENQLHDRASYRYFWNLLEKAHATARVLPDEIKHLFNQNS